MLEYVKKHQTFYYLFDDSVSWLSKRIISHGEFAVVEEAFVYGMVANNMPVRKCRDNYETLMLSIMFLAEEPWEKTLNKYIR